MFFMLKKLPFSFQNLFALFEEDAEGKVEWEGNLCRIRGSRHRQQTCETSCDGAKFLKVQFSCHDLVCGNSQSNTRKIENTSFGCNEHGGQV
jgi:hypothetical protein